MNGCIDGSLYKECQQQRCVKTTKSGSLLVSHVVMRVNQGIHTLFHGDVVNSVGEFAEILDTKRYGIRSVVPSHHGVGDTPFR